LVRERLPHALELHRQITARVAGLVSRYDVLLSATLAAPPIKIGEMQPTPLETRQRELLGELPINPLLKRMLAEVSHQ
ncbi:amidase, partial [Burkholderia pseudomallei]